MSGADKRRLRVIADKTEKLLRTEFDPRQRDQIDMADDVACKEGCNACCAQYVSITPAEATWILTRYPEVVRARRRALKAQAVLEVECLTQGTAEQGQAPSPLGTTANIYWRHRHACAFLKDSGSCSVYEARPLACRAHVVQGDPAQCSVDDVNAQVRTLRMQELEILLYDEMSSWFDCPGQEQTMVLMPLAAGVLDLYLETGGRI